MFWLHSGPTWRLPALMIATVFVAAIALDSIGAVWGERRPIGGWFEEFVSRVLFYGGILATFASALWIGSKLHHRTGSQVLAWVAGLSGFVAIGLVVAILASSLPGIDWRYERLMRSE